MKFKVKPITLTKNKANNSILTRIRKQARERLGEIFLQHEFNQILGDIVSGRLQKGLKQELRKIYPVSIFEIRKVELLNR